jgi:hypothetical protein
MRAQPQQAWLLLEEDLGDGAVALLGMRALMGDRVAPGAKLRSDRRHYKRADGKERVPEVLNMPLDFSLLVPRPGRTRPGREVIVPGELEQPRMKADRGGGRSRTALRKLS